MDTERQLATLDEDGWELDDAESIAAANPDTFWIPPRERRDTLQPGEQVKLIFRILTVDEADNEEVNVERMWVVVTGREGAYYTGELDNQPLCTDEINPGMPLCFEARHVINIHDADEPGETDRGQEQAGDAEGS